MQRFILVLSVLGVLLLASCATGSTDVINSNGKVIGTVSVQGLKSATFLNAHGDTRGKIRGNVVRDDSGRNLGTIEEPDGHVMMMDGHGSAVGSLNNGKDCYGKGQAKLGTVRGTVSTNVVGAACLVLLLPKN